ncbi:MAG: Ig-like domain repeat protein [Methanosphaera sp.]|nr:Ig-like domain repeat protein [Methanosphaera sp.]
MEKTVPTLTTEEITATAGGKITLTATITDNNKVINTGKIVFKVNGKTVKDANGKVIYAHVDANGEVSIDYNLGNLKTGTYTIEATFIAPNYDKITSNTTMTVVKA